MTCLEYAAKSVPGEVINWNAWCNHCLALWNSLFGQYPEGVDGKTIIGDCAKDVPLFER